MRSILLPLGSLRWPFVAASGSIYLLALLWRVYDGSSWYFAQDLMEAVVFGTLGCVVLYAVMRALAGEGRGS